MTKLFHSFKKRVKKSKTTIIYHLFIKEAMPENTHSSAAWTMCSAMNPNDSEIIFLLLRFHLSLMRKFIIKKKLNNH